MKDHRLIVRMDAELWRAFSRVCQSKDIPASHAVREFIRDYVKKNAQGNLPLVSDSADKIRSRGVGKA